MGHRRARNILVTGASIAGPALAYWLADKGFEVTLVERAHSIRAGGYAIDVRGTAVDVIDRMGLLPAARAAHVATRKITFVGPSGREIGHVNEDDFGAPGRHVELARGALTSLLYEATKDRVQYRFGDAVASLNQDPGGVDVTFRSGAQARFDLVLSCEGLHSTTRELVFGPEARFSHYLGYCFAICELPNDYGLSREAVVYNKPGRGAALYATNDGPNLYGLFTFRRPPPSPEEIADPERQRDAVARAFADDGWLVPRMLAAMRKADDLYFDATMQICMPAWSKGRVGLVGDAAFAPSFFTGQGTSMGLVGAYVLAGALATQPDHVTAFQAYEETARPYITANQAIVKAGSTAAAPATAFQLWVRNSAIRLVPLIKRLGLLHGTIRPAYEALALPNYGPA